MAYHASAQSTVNSSTTISPTMPTITAGDQLLAFSSQDGSGNTYTVTAGGWTKLNTTNITGPDGQTISLYAKIAAGGDTLTLTSSATGQWSVIVTSHSGRTATASPNFSVTTPNTSSNASAVTVTLTGITAAASDDLVCCGMPDITNDTVAWSATTVPTGTTIRQNCLAPNNWAQQACATADSISSGATGNQVFIFTGTTGHAGWSGYVVNLAASGGGGDVTVALTGKSATFTAGSLVAGSSLALTGQQSIFTAGNLGGTDADALVGQKATFTGGILSPNITVALTGQSATFTAGTVSVNSNVTIALVGQSAAFTAGSMVPSSSVALTGQTVTATAGLLVPGISISLTGKAITTSVGNLSPAITISLHGSIITTSTGVLIPSGGIPVGGTNPYFVGFVANVGSLMGKF